MSTPCLRSLLSRSHNSRPLPGSRRYPCGRLALPGPRRPLRRRTRRGHVGGRGVHPVAVPVRAGRLVQAAPRLGHTHCPCGRVQRRQRQRLHGSAGETSVQVTVETLADQLGVLPEEIFVASTGVIGSRCPTSSSFDLPPSPTPSVPPRRHGRCRPMPSAPPIPSPRLARRVDGGEPCRRHRQAAA